MAPSAPSGSPGKKRMTSTKMESAYKKKAKGGLASTKHETTLTKEKLK